MALIFDKGDSQEARTELTRRVLERLTEENRGVHKASKAWTPPDFTGNDVIHLPERYLEDLVKWRDELLIVNNPGQEELELNDRRTG